MQDFHRLFIYVLPLEIQLLRGEGWDLINRLIPSHIFFCQCHDRTLISNILCRWSPFLFRESWFIARFVDIGGIVENHCYERFFHNSKILWRINVSKN